VEAATVPKSSQIFEITYPVALNSKKDKYLPSIVTPSNRRRRVGVEVHKLLPQFADEKEEGAASSPQNSAGSSFFKSIRNVRPVTSVISDEEIQDTSPEICYIKIFVNTATNPFETLLHRKIKKYDDQQQENCAGSSYDDLFSTNNSVMMETSNGMEMLYGLGDWYAKYKIPVKLFDIVQKKNRTLIVSFLFRGLTLRREFIFDTEEDANRFCQVIEKEKQLLGIRAKTRLEAALGDIKVEKGEKLSLLFDIVSGTNIPTKDPKPYVVVRLHGKQIHSTDWISNSTNPIWTLRKGSLFILTIDLMELFEDEDGLIFEVKDYDSVSKHKSLGAFSVSPRTIYKWNGERREFDLKALSGEKHYDQGKLALRVRKATDHDFEFLKKYKESKKMTITGVADDLLPKIEAGGSSFKKLLKVHRKIEMIGSDKGQTKYLVRPGPDPKRPIETEWLTKDQIEEEALKPSHSWLDIGSGNLGKIFVEVIACDGLPNFDIGSKLGNLTDAFVSLVYEDCFARTHTVDDCLSPRFMPWSRRAFIFNMMHTSSQLFVGVFDSDVHTAHDLIGRVSVDLTNFIPNMIYTLKYNLYPSAKCNPRENKFGSITIRLRMELENERALLLSNFRFPESVYVNSETQKDFRVMHQTVHGGVDMKRFDHRHIKAYIEELYDYVTIWYYLEDSFVSIILWRSKTIIPIPVPRFSSLSIGWVDVMVPLHSFVAFLCMISIVENLDLLPSFVFGSIGWILVATMEFRTSGPNPWRRCKSFQHYLWSLISGHGLMRPRDIAKNENSESIALREEAWRKRVQDAEERARQNAEDYAREQEEYWKEMEERGDIDGDLSFVKRGFSFNPATAYLYPIQQWLGIIINILRITKNIVIWEESYLSFWFALIAFLLSFLSLFVPWSLIVKWLLRVVVYICFGPWMKLVDLFYFQVIESEEESNERLNKIKLERKKYLAEQLLQAQIVKENNTKLKDFKQYMFGKYITKVNIMKKDRFIDEPLSESSAVVYNPNVKSLGAIAMQEAGYHRVRVDGQQLVGEMIPKKLEKPSTEAPFGKPTKKSDNDSYGVAVGKVGSIVVGAMIAGYFVPSLLSSSFSDFCSNDSSIGLRCFYT
jgi:hypothetical protein